MIRDDNGFVYRLTSVEEVEELANKVYKLGTNRPYNIYQSYPFGNNRGECLDKSVGCIVGQAARELGYSLVDTISAYSISSEYSEEPCAKFLIQVQSYQDSGGNWYKAIKSGLNYSNWKPTAC